MLDEKESAGSAGGVRMMTLGEASDFCGGAMDSLGGVGAAQELGILEGGAGCGIDDGVGVVEDPLQVGNVGGGIGRRLWGKGNNHLCVEPNVCAGEDAVKAFNGFGPGADLMEIDLCFGWWWSWCRYSGSAIAACSCLGGRFAGGFQCASTTML